MCLDSFNWALWVRFHGRSRYHSLIDGSNIWCVDRTDPWGPEMDHPRLGRSYMEVMPSYDMSCALIRLTGLYERDSMADIHINPSSMSPKIGVWTGPTLGIRNGPYAFGPQLSRSSAVVWYVMCLDSLNWARWVKFHGRYWFHTSSMGPTFGVWVGPTLGVSK